jgi:predicted aminopeptidase
MRVFRIWYPDRQFVSARLGDAIPYVSIKESIMNASGKQSGGYGGKKTRSKKTAEPRTRKVREFADEVKWREAMDAMLAAIRELLEAERRAHAGEHEMAGHVAAMRKLLRYVRRKMSAGKIGGEEQSSRRKKSPSPRKKVNGGWKKKRM